MKKIHSLILAGALTIGLTACQEKEIDTKLTLNTNHFPVENLKTDEPHHEKVTGRLTVNGKAVEGAELQISEKHKMETNEKGNFVLTIDTSVIKEDIVRVSNVDDATIKGKKIDEKTKEKLLTLEQSFSIHYPITVQKVEENKKDRTLVDVHLKAQTNEKEDFPNFSVEKFKISGTIKDTDGNPVEGATVNIRRDGVEGFSMSDPSNKEGKFEMYYTSKDNENHFFSVRIPEKNLVYTLPTGKMYQFPNEFGVNIDITLPKEGTIIDDKPPTLVTTPVYGALYKGILIGANVTEGTTYDISIPNLDGTFTLTLPKEEWEKNPTFYQILYRGFHEEELKPGKVISSTMIPQPKEYEPKTIQATEK